VSHHSAASAAAGRGDIEEAGHLWGAVEAVESKLGITLLTHERERYERSLRDLDAPEFGAAVDAGRALALEDAVQYALTKRSFANDRHERA
jgi:hypothetical protein